MCSLLTAIRGWPNIEMQNKQRYYLLNSPIDHPQSNLPCTIVILGQDPTHTPFYCMLALQVVKSWAWA